VAKLDCNILRTGITVNLDAEHLMLLRRIKKLCLEVEEFLCGSSLLLLLGAITIFELSYGSYI